MLARGRTRIGTKGRRRVVAIATVLVGLIVAAAAMAAGAGEPPTMQSVTPKKGDVAGGTHVLITGRDFRQVQSVHFGATEVTSFEVVDIGHIRAVSPPHTAGRVEVSVTTEGGTSGPAECTGRNKRCDGNVFNYAGLRATEFSPSSGPTAGGTTVTVTGAGFAVGTNTTSFKFGKVGASSVECSSTTECTLVTPAQKKAGPELVLVQVGKAKNKRSESLSYNYE